MEQKELRLRKVQYLICDIMDEMNMESEKKNLETLQKVIDHLSGAIRGFSGSIGYVFIRLFRGKSAYCSLFIV